MCVAPIGQIVEEILRLHFQRLLEVSFFGGESETFLNTQHKMSDFVIEVNSRLQNSANNHELKSSATLPQSAKY